MRRPKAAAAALTKPKMPTPDCTTPSLRSFPVCGSVPLSAVPVELAFAAESELDELEGTELDELGAELDAELVALEAELELALAVEPASAVLVAVSLAGVSGARAAVEEDSALEPDSLVFEDALDALSELDSALELILASDDSFLALEDSALELDVLDSSFVL